MTKVNVDVNFENSERAGYKRKTSLNIRGVSEKYPTCVYIFATERSIGLCGA